ncbi:MAG: hypothetical protein HY078_07560 [Elusimicrobia bacterium]|nr:hypothetical protein [Elusimicrobiota bacterium]
MTRQPPPPDPELVDYLRKNIKKYGVDALKSQLMSEGISEDDIESAIEATTRRKLSNKRLVPLIVGASAALTLLVLLVLFSRKPSKPIAPVNMSGQFDKKAVSGPAGPSRPFIGHSGYVLQLPPDYSAVSDFKDLSRKMEIVYLFPKGTDPQNFGDEGIYGQLGILRMEVSSRRIPEGMISMEAVRRGVSRTLQNRRATFTSREVQVGGMPAIIINITEPFPLTQSFVLGSKVIYVLTGGLEDQRFTGVLESLREVSQ